MSWSWPASGSQVRMGFSGIGRGGGGGGDTTSWRRRARHNGGERGEGA